MSETMSRVQPVLLPPKPDECACCRYPKEGLGPRLLSPVTGEAYHTDGKTVRLCVCQDA